MSKKRLCDVCDSEITQTWVPPNNPVKGEGSAVVSKSLRRRLLNFVLGPLVRLKVWSKKGGDSPWNTLDLCSSCKTEIFCEVSERVDADETSESQHECPECGHEWFHIRAKFTNEDVIDANIECDDCGAEVPEVLNQ